MPDYDFSGLCPRSFEHMVQALSCKILGPGLVVFGDGPDGGREATFTGKTGNFPSAVECWDGYVVVQAKFCHRPVGKTHADGQWALAELKEELDAFVNRNKKRKNPEYYIFVTNVVLSPKQNSGTKDKTASLISRYKRQIGMKDYRIWDFDQLCRFLDADQGVRNAYEVWITAGDVFAKLASAFESKWPDFMKVMVNYLQKELLDDHYSKLEQAGHSPENRVPLERVFVDLPVFGERRSEAPEEGEDGKTFPPGFLSAIVETSACSLKPDSESGLGVGPSRSLPGIISESGRYVLIGGPGQGKSTLSQFLCQIHRAQLLNTASGLDVDARNVINSIIEQCKIQRVQMSLARRFPMRIELARFAKALATDGIGKAQSLLNYLGNKIKDRTDYDITADHLRDWLHKYPWLIILDGLDEVPSSSNREQVLSATKDFLVDIATCEADVLLITTTRPQGYNAEFSPERYRHLWLAPLSIPRALHYAGTLVNLTYRYDSQRRDEVLGRLQDAAKVDATARLMESPLQVTIMARLLAQIAKPPQERYKLFQQYYKVIYRREMERGVPQLSQLLRDYETDIDAIHYRAGLILQIESERAQHTDATLSLDEFKGIVQHRLDREGHSEDTRRRMTEAIVRCAMERLVFLVPTQSERVGFEIRSLQEFMASEALMDGGDRVVTSRIRKIATVPFWQNVLLFAAGKCFAERQWLRDSVSEICTQMNDDPSDLLGHAVLAGSHLALSLLEDGPARRQPAYSHSLARRALGLLLLPPNEAHDRLADVYEPGFEGVYKEEIQERMDSKNMWSRLGAWRVLLRLVGKQNIAWPSVLAEACWPLNRKEQELILSEFNPISNKWLWEKYQGGFFQLPLLTDAHSFTRIKKDYPDQAQFMTEKSVEAALNMESMWWEDMRLESLTIQATENFKITAGVVSLSESRKSLATFNRLKKVHNYWVPLIEAARFATNPTRMSLAEALETIADFVPINPLTCYIRRLPWPLAACILAGKDSDYLRLLARRVRSGALGDISDWHSAELRWAGRGIGVKDLIHMTDERWPIGNDIGENGFPFVFGFFGCEWNAAPEKLMPEFWQLLPGTEAKAAFAPHVLHYFFSDFPRGSKKWSKLSTDEFKHFLEEVINALQTPTFMPYELLMIIHEISKETDKEVRFLDALGRKTSDILRYSHNALYRFGTNLPDRIEKITDILSKAVEEDLSLSGAIKLLKILASKGHLNRVPSNLKKLRQSENPETALAGLVLSLCRKGDDTKSIETIVDDILERWHDDTKTLAQFLETSVAQMANQTDPIRFFLRFWYRVGEKNVKARQHTLRVMLDLLGRRITNLQEMNVWKQLDLPDGLYHQVLV